MYPESLSVVLVMCYSEEGMFCMQLSTSKLLWHADVNTDKLMAEALTSQHVQMSHGSTVQLLGSVSSPITQCNSMSSLCSMHQAALGLCRELVCVRCCVRQLTLLLFTAAVTSTGLLAPVLQLCNKNGKTVVAFCFGESRLVPCVPSSS